MPTKISLDRDAEGYSEYLVCLYPLVSARKVRAVVTRSGSRVRGFAPSLKAPDWARYESGLERDMLRMLEVSSLAKRIHTHPFVMKLVGQAKPLHYTPDIVVEFEEGGVIVEVKARYFLRKPEQRTRFETIANALRAERIEFVLITEDQIRPEGLQEELSELLRQRPLVGRGRSGLDLTAWDPLHRAASDLALEERWRVAQRECDALLKRLMRPDPGEALPMDC